MKVLRRIILLFMGTVLLAMLFSPEAFAQKKYIRMRDPETGEEYLLEKDYDREDDAPEPDRTCEISIVGDYEGIVADGVSELEIQLDATGHQYHTFLLDCEENNGKCPGEIERNADNTIIIFRPYEPTSENDYLKNTVILTAKAHCYPLGQHDYNHMVGAEPPATFFVEQPPLFFVHGVNSSGPDCFLHFFIKALRDHWKYGYLSYDSADSIDYNAKKLKKHLREYIESVKDGKEINQEPDRVFRVFGGRKTNITKVDIVAHSMGGLVTRTYIQTSGLYGNNIRNFIMLGTPNHGSNCANVIDALPGKEKASYQQMFEGSSFFKTLNSKNFVAVAKAKGIRPYTIAGTGFITPELVTVEAEKEEEWFVRIPETYPDGRWGYRLHRFTQVKNYTKLWALFTYRGDGIVTVDSVHLPGVPLYCLYNAHASLAVFWPTAEDADREIQFFIKGKFLDPYLAAIARSETAFKMVKDLIFTGQTTGLVDCYKRFYGLRKGVSANSKSPGTLHAYDSYGHHVGLNERGEVENQIGEGVCYSDEYYGEHEAIKITGRNDIVFKFAGDKKGKFGLRVTRWDESGNIEEVVSENVPTDKNTQHVLDAMSKDFTFKKEKRTIKAKIPLERKTRFLRKKAKKLGGFLPILFWMVVMGLLVKAFLWAKPRMEELQDKLKKKVAELKETKPTQEGEKGSQDIKNKLLQLLTSLKRFIVWLIPIIVAVVGKIFNWIMSAAGKAKEQIAIQMEKNKEKKAARLEKAQAKKEAAAQARKVAQEKKAAQKAVQSQAAPELKPSKTKIKISVRDALKFGAMAFLKNIGVVIIGYILLVLIGAVQVSLYDQIPGAGGPICEILFIVSMIAFFFGFLRMMIRIGLNQKPKLGDFFSGIVRFFQIIVGILFYLALICIGAVLFIIPGIIFALRGQYFFLLLFERKIGPLEALKQSFAVTKSAAWGLFLLWISLLIINGLGVLALGFGLLITIPITVITLSKVYAQLTEPLTKEEEHISIQGMG